jgi:LysM repeat protein
MIRLGKSGPRLAIMALAALLAAAGCDRMITPRHAQQVKDADARAAQGDYLRAINLYEAALDDTPQCADIHFKLALIYDDKLNDPLNALHHYKRYLLLDPNGARAGEARNLVKRDEVTLLTSLSGDSVVTRAEATRLRNENLNLRRQVEQRPKATAEPSAPRAENATAAERASGTYVVQPGDTLFSIARKFYHSAGRWKEIRDANKLENAKQLKPGETLQIP